jgi:hypothetical protein
MRISGFRNHVKYDESSFEQAMDLSFEAADVNNSILYFDVRTPTGSVMLTDPTLEVVIDIAVTTPQPAYGDVQYVGG